MPLYYNDTDVILIYPKTGVDLGATVAPPHAVLSLAAPLLKAGYKVAVIDQRVEEDWRESLVKALKQKPVCAGISTMTGTQIYFALQAARVIREHTDGAVPIIWGGAHPSSLPEQTLDHDLVDIVCVGEGDITFPEIVKALSGKRPLEGIAGIAYKDGDRKIIAPGRALCDVEELLPVPWELVEVEKYIHRDFYLKGMTRSMDIGQTSRGCPYQCGFCSSATLRQRKWRAMSVEKSLKMILEPVRRFNLDSIWIRDDEFYIDRQRAFQICQGIIRSGLKFKWYSSGTRIDVFNRATTEEILSYKASGADTLKFGAESGSDRMLKLMKKGIRVEDTVRANLKAKAHGIVPVFALIIGFPTETFEDIHQTIDLFVRLKKDNPRAQFEVIGTFTALPQTPLYSLALQHGLQPPDHLEGWIDWLSDEYDISGRIIPWFNKQERNIIGNITYMSILANSSLNAIGGISQSAMRLLLRSLFYPFSRFERFRLRHKWYRFAPELRAARTLRKKIFYRNESRIS